MSTEQKLERMRLKLQQESHDMSSDLSMQTVLVCREMKGWTLDYVMDMPIWRYHQVLKQLKRISDETKAENERQSKIGR